MLHDREEALALRQQAAIARRRQGLADFTLVLLPLLVGPRHLERIDTGGGAFDELVDPLVRLRLERGGVVRHDELEVVAVIDELQNLSEIPRDKVEGDDEKSRAIGQQHRVKIDVKLEHDINRQAPLVDHPRDNGVGGLPDGQAGRLAKIKRGEEEGRAMHIAEDPDRVVLSGRQHARTKGIAGAGKAIEEKIVGGVVDINSVAKLRIGLEDFGMGPKVAEHHPKWPERIPAQIIDSRRHGNGKRLRKVHQDFVRELAPKDSLTGDRGARKSWSGTA